ncbi:MAG TPA: DUF2569 domain-containing protein [candidate division Zixibacteria bacterium]|nr:DUF2569 domain-containing protein [candidate division Zixibacteria bacterium]
MTTVQTQFPNPVQTPPKQVLYKAPQNLTGPEGLSGWLILVGIGLMVSPIRIAAIEFTILSLFFDGTWSAISSSAGEFYNPMLAVIIPLEFVLNMAFIFGFVFLIYLYFTKSSIFPRWFISVYLANLIFILLDAVIVKFAVPDQPLFDPETTKEFARSLAACCVWIPYMIKSKRVEATFVN